MTRQLSANGVNTELSTSNNRHVIDDALNLLAKGVQPFVTGRTGVNVDADPSTSITLMLDCWDEAFHGQLGYRVKNLVYEVRDIRNDWAHHQHSFNDDDTDRALDTIGRLLTAIDAPEQAARVHRLKDEHRRQRYAIARFRVPLQPSETQYRWARNISIRKNLIGSGVTRRFEFNGVRYEIPHDELVEVVREITPWLQTKSWNERGGYSTSQPSKALLARLRPFAFNANG